MAGRSPQVGNVRRELDEDILNLIRLPKRYWGVKVEGIKPQDSSHAKVIRQYMGNLPSAVNEGIGLLLYGPPSHGKTGCGSVVLMEASRWHYSCLFVRASRLCQAARDKTPFNDAHTILQKAEMVDVLLLDDMAKEGSEDVSYHQRIINDLIRDRTDAVLPTIITTNLDGADEIEEAYTPSMMTILKAHFRAVQVMGHDYRGREQGRIKDILSKDPE